MTRVPRVIRGRRRPPERLLVYGVEGVGKTSFAAAMPRPIFLDVDRSSDRLDVERIGDPYDPENLPPANYDELVAAIRALRDPAFRRDRMTLAIDTGDKVEQEIIHPEATRRYKPEKGKPQPKTIGEIGFAKGYVEAVRVWGEFLAELDQLQTITGMNVIINCHAHPVTVNNLGGEDLSAYEPALYSGKNASAAELLREWADTVLFMCFDDRAKNGGGDGERKRSGPKKAFTTGERVMYACHQGWAMAKNRCCLPEQLPLSYDAYSSAVEAFYQGAWSLETDDPTTLRRMVESHAIVVQGWPETVPEWREEVFGPHLEKAGEDPEALRKLYRQLNDKITARNPPKEG